MIFGCFGRSIEFNFSITPKPSKCGIITSSTNKSGCVFCTNSSASIPSFAIPNISISSSLDKYSFNNWQKSLLSSANTILIFSFTKIPPNNKFFLF